MKKAIIVGGLALALSACAPGPPRDTSPTNPPAGELASIPAHISGNRTACDDFYNTMSAINEMPETADLGAIAEAQNMINRMKNTLIEDPELSTVVSQFSWLSDHAVEDGERIISRCTKLAEEEGGWGDEWTGGGAQSAIGAPAES